jgi:DNA recombination protein RmuC
MTEHFIRLKKSIDGTVDAYNKVVASFESRVLTCARRFQDVGVAHSEEIALLEPVEKITNLVGTQMVEP